MNDQASKPLDAKLAYSLVYPFRNTSLTPNHFTCIRLLFGILACAAFSIGGFLWTNIGAACFVISSFLDHTDGEFARITGKMSRFGHYFDIASDAVAVPILVGLGVDELSVSIPSIPEIKAAVRASELSACKELAEQALQQATADDVRELVASKYPELV